MKRACLALLALASAAPAFAASPNDAVRAWRSENEARLLDEFTALLAIPNVATDTANIGRNADAIAKLMEARGLAPRILPGVDGSPPAVYGEWRVPGAKRTLMFYAHYDGQPVDPAKWTTPPWQPTWYGDAGTRGDDSRLRARSSSDDKAGVMAIIAAAEALKATGLAPRANVKFFFEGEEEQGSPHLGAMLRANEELLAADLWLIVDGPVHPSGRKQLAYGVRGDANVDLTVYGPLRPLHSGHYGNWAPNPGMLLARLLATMKDDDGRVTIAGWYDDVAPLGELEKAALAAAPQADDTLRAELGLARTELPGKSLMEAINLPSLNVNGMRSADVGENASNVIPTIAQATLDLRFVKGIDPKTQFERLRAHVEKAGYKVLDREPTLEERRTHARIATLVLLPGYYRAGRTAMDLPVAQEVAKALQSATDAPLVALPTMGGSLPLAVIEDELGAPFLSLPLANHDNNQHAENENLRLGNLRDGIVMIAAVMRL
ncbi:MAG TPA: M20/M25/M40 family metallo-hydrolase [Xanthomonadales bacterium]|nr:M20/M25/M40 family metallo-hydrolase [Xanthomonadales bacterium]